MKKDKEKHIENHFAEGSNCQVFNGDISGCVFAMPGSTVTQHPVQQALKEAVSATVTDETPCQLSAELNSRKARRILDRAVEAQLLTSDYQRPKDMAWWKMACMADAIGDELCLSNKWVVFCSLWGNSNLRKYNTDKEGMTDYNDFRKFLKKEIL